jgi:hypothetical protein
MEGFNLTECSSPNHMKFMSSFQFGSDFYKQKKGIAMRSPLSSVLCNIFMEQLEKKEYLRLKLNP